MGDGELKALLPCKPDRATRRQNLAGYDLDLTLLGCEANGGLYALAVTQLPNESLVPQAQAHWRAKLLENMHASSSNSRSQTVKGATSQMTPAWLSAVGTNPDGGAIQVQGLWFARGARLYHAAIYAERISDDMSEPFFSGVGLQ